MGLTRDEAEAAVRHETVGAERGGLLGYISRLTEAELQGMRVDVQDGAEAVVEFIRERKQQGAGPSVAGDSVALLGPLEVATFLKAAFRLRSSKQRDADMAKRHGQIILAAGDQELKDAGQYLALSSYEPALDHLLRSMSRMAADYSRPTDVFITTVQLLRAVGAPGLGKSTFAKSAWSLLLPRLKAVKADEERWRAWQALGVDGLQERLESSWKTPCGPLVYLIDMSEDDLRQVHELERGLEPRVQVAARMLWAAVDMQTKQDSTYAEFLASLRRNYPGVLTSLTPRIIQYFVHLSAGLPASTPSLVVFVWDEANAVPADEEGTGVATFFQHQLSAVVSSRKAALEAKGAVNVLLVPVVASTRGSAMSLINTASKKAGCTDLRLPLIKSVDDLALLVMDLMRRLPLPQDFGLGRIVSREEPLSDVSDEVRGKLVQACPAHVRQLLDWVGSNPRLLVSALSILSLQSIRSPYNIVPGNFKWFTDGAVPLNKSLSLLLDAMKAQGWSRWLGSSGSPLACILLQATTYGLCNMAVSRTTVLCPPGNVTLQQLEADAVIELRPADGKKICSASSSRNSSNGGADNTASAGPAANEDPASSNEVSVVLPPLLLALVLRDIAPSSSSGVTLSFQHIIMQLSGFWRQREYDDVGALTLRMQLLKDSLGRSVVELRHLFSPLASTDLGELCVLIPSYGFSPHSMVPNVDEADVEHLMTQVAWPPHDEDMSKKPPDWAFVFNGHNGPGDSMVVMRVCDAAGEPSGGLVVIHLQSKLQTGPELKAASFDKINQEACKVPFITRVRSPGGQSATVQQVFLYVSDERLPISSGMRHSDGSSGGLPAPKRKQGCKEDSSTRQPAAAREATGSGNELDQLAHGGSVTATNGLLVLAVFRNTQWVLRGAVQRIKDLLDEAVQGKKMHDRQVSELILKR